MLDALVTVALLAQAATRIQVQSGYETARTKALHSLSEPESPSDKSAATVPWKTLSSEAGDDPTLSASAVVHEPSKAARKSAKDAEHAAKKGDHQAAINGFQEALRADPQYYEAENNLALEFEAIGKTDDAEKTLRHLAVTAPEHVLAQANLGALLLSQSRYAEAEQVARVALEKHRYSFKASFLLGTALVDQGHWTEEAKAALQYAQVKYPQANVALDRWPAHTATK